MGRNFTFHYILKSLNIIIISQQPVNFKITTFCGILNWLMVLVTCLTKYKIMHALCNMWPKLSMLSPSKMLLRWVYIHLNFTEIQWQKYIKYGHTYIFSRILKMSSLNHICTCMNLEQPLRKRGCRRKNSKNKQIKTTRKRTTKQGNNIANPFANTNWKIEHKKVAKIYHKRTANISKNKIEIWVKPDYLSGKYEL